MVLAGVLIGAVFAIAQAMTGGRRDFPSLRSLQASQYALVVNADQARHLLGLLIGLLFGIFSVDDWWQVVLAGVLIGALFGAVFGAIAQAMTGGQRYFSSLHSLEAASYAVTVDSDHADQARQLLAELRAGPAAR